MSENIGERLAKDSDAAQELSLAVGSITTATEQIVSLIGNDTHEDLGDLTRNELRRIAQQLARLAERASSLLPVDELEFSDDDPLADDFDSLTDPIPEAVDVIVTSYGISGLDPLAHTDDQGPSLDTIRPPKLSGQVVTGSRGWDRKRDVTPDERAAAQTVASFVSTLDSASKELFYLFYGFKDRCRDITELGAHYGVKPTIISERLRELRQQIKTNLGIDTFPHNALVELASDERQKLPGAV